MNYHLCGPGWGKIVESLRKTAKTTSSLMMLGVCKLVAYMVNKHKVKKYSISILKIKMSFDRTSLKFHLLWINSKQFLWVLQKPKIFLSELIWQVKSAVMICCLNLCLNLQKIFPSWISDFGKKLNVDS